MESILPLVNIAILPKVNIGFSFLLACDLNGFKLELVPDQEPAEYEEKYRPRCSYDESLVDSRTTQPPTSEGNVTKPLQSKIYF